MTEANQTPGIGDVEIQLDGKTYKLTPSYRAFSGINREIPGGIMQAINSVGSFDINAAEVIIFHGVGFVPDLRHTLGEKIFRTSVRKLTPKLMTYLVNLNNGGVPPSQEDNAVNENPTTETTT